MLLLTAAMISLVIAVVIVMTIPMSRQFAMCSRTAEYWAGEVVSAWRARQEQHQLLLQEGVVDDGHNSPLKVH